MISVNDFLELLTPYDIFSPKIRLGPHCDGGYVINEVALQNCNSIFTYGVSDDIRYEIDFVNRYNNPAYLFDHTIHPPKLDNELLIYKHEGLGFNQMCNCFLAHYNEYNKTADVLLKIDVEGCEYDYLENANIDLISKITTGIMLEIHWISNKERFNRFINILNKLSQYYILTHIHGNNYGEVWNFENYIIPDVLELSFVNRKYISSFEKDSSLYPIVELDYPNNPNQPDCLFPFNR